MFHFSSIRDPIYAWGLFSFYKLPSSSSIIFLASLRASFRVSLGIPDSCFFPFEITHIAHQFMFPHSSCLDQDFLFHFFSFRGRPPLRPFSRAAADFRSLFTEPPRRPRVEAAVLTQSLASSTSFSTSSSRAFL